MIPEAEPGRATPGPGTSRQTLAGLDWAAPDARTSCRIRGPGRATPGTRYQLPDPGRATACDERRVSGRGRLPQRRVSANSAWPELDADPRSGRPGGLRYGVLPGALAATAHHEKITVPKIMAECRAAAARPQEQRTGRADGDDRDHGVRPGAAPDRVAVPCDAVPAVPVEAQPGGQELLAEFRCVVRVQCLPELGERGIGQGLARSVEADQPGDVHHPVVHLPFLGLPWHGVDQPAQQRVGPGDPAPPHIDPGPVGKDGPPYRRAQLTRSHLVGEVKQRTLECARHEPSIDVPSNAYSI